MNKIVYIPREKCCVCGSLDLHAEQKIRDFDTSLGVFDLIRCANCGMYYTSPYPNAATLPYLYASRDTRNFDTNNSDILQKIKVFLAKKSIAKIIKGCHQPISVVDFGCGNGMFSLCFQEVIPQANVYAVDFAPEAPAQLKKVKGSAHVPQYMQMADFYNSNQKYDIIFLRHVLEHVENPVDLLKALLKKLTKTGFIYLEVPNIKNGLRLFWNNYLPSYYPPYHLVHFTPENLAFLCDKLQVDYVLAQAEMPVMSNIVANLFHQKLNNIHRMIGILLHPIQLLLCYKEHTVLVAKISNKASL